MPYPIRPQPAAATRPRRPAAVTIAAALLLVMAAAGLANAVVGLVSLQGIIDRFRSAADATDASEQDVERFVAALRIGLALGLIIALVVAVLLVVLAVGVLRGSPGARIATWLVGALGALCGVCGLVILVAQRLVSLDAESADADVLAALTDAYPGWWLAVNAALLTGQAIGYLVVALLLALPPANAFFRRRRGGPEQLDQAAPGEPDPGYSSARPEATPPARPEPAPPARPEAAPPARPEAAPPARPEAAPPARPEAAPPPSPSKPPPSQS
jgi:hypothetical protein